MSARRPGLRRLASWVVATSLMVSAGCLTPHANPIEAVAPELAEECQKKPADQRDHVHVFLINGNDPFQCANLGGVRDYLNHLGFCHSYYGQMFHSGRFAKEIRRIYQEDPQARFVLIGFSLGAPPTYALAREAHAEGIPIDLVIFLTGKGMKPCGAELDPSIRTVSVVAHTVAWKDYYPRPTNKVDVSDRGHFMAVADPRTVDMLARELTEVVDHVPLPPKETMRAAEPSLVEALQPVAHLQAGRLAVDLDRVPTAAEETDE